MPLFAESMISIEPAAPRHCASVVSWLADPNIHRWLTQQWRDPGSHPALVSTLFRSKKNCLYIAVVDEVPCGITALADIEQLDRTAMLWYLLGNRALQGRGVMTKAVRMFVERVFREKGFESLYAWVMEDNEPSIHLLGRVGFSPAGRIRFATRSGNRQVHRLLFDITRAEVM